MDNVDWVVIRQRVYIGVRVWVRVGIVVVRLIGKRVAEVIQKSINIIMQYLMFIN